MKSLTVELKKKDLEIAKQFANDRVHLSIDHYKKRGQGSLDKITHDITIGALGEIGIHRAFKRLGIKTSKPDFNVYETKKKSYDADLNDDSGNRFHCKSQCVESANKYGKSYILQYGGNGMGHVDKLFRNVTNRDFLVPCLVDVENMEVIIFGCIKIETIMKKDLVKMPRVKWLEYSKRAIYLDDLFTLSWYERWGRLKRQSVIE